MVTRKPVAPPLATAPQPPSSSSNPPYPYTPTAQSAKSTASSNSIYSADLKKSPAFDLIDVSKAQQRQQSDSEESDHEWDDSDDNDTPDEVEVPKPLQVRNSQQGMEDPWKNESTKLPESLRVGPPGGHRPRKSLEGQKYDDEAQANPWAEQAVKPPSLNSRADSNNPYHQRNGGFVPPDSSQSEWQEVKPPPVPSAAPPPIPNAAPPPIPSGIPPPVPQSSAPVELPSVQSPPASKSPSHWLSEMSMEEQRPASWETAEILRVPEQGQSPLPPPSSPSQARNRPISTWWQDPPSSPSAATKAQPSLPPYPVDSRPQSEYEPPPGPPPSHQQGLLIDHEDAPKPPPNGMAPIDTSMGNPSSSSAAVPETPGTQLKQQRNQTYQIKHIRWLEAADNNARPSIRQSPIMTQNANGPCPLLALVNALVLSTPAEQDTALIETLRTREQISLGLLLDAVFDELMSGRRGDTATSLPDVGQLYSFLLALHTGMNVNPRFVTPTETPRGSLDGHPAAWNSVHPTHRAQRKAGAFEETKEMRLYSTFNIPLIHGWTAPADSPAYAAFVRSAQTFEDAQNIQFLESELEDKLQSEGLPPQEQQTLQDIQTIKAFLSTWPTQLTDFGLQTISESLAPGQFAILFRNDHFSTIYKEPKHGALMTLVTDAGYATHDEIVWESLVDVNGSASEMFSGDFRIVSHNQDVRLNQNNSAGGNDGWQTVPGRSSRHGKQSSTDTSEKQSPPPLPGPRPNIGSSSMVDDADLAVPDPEARRKASEQEDHDLALALQLQEEEEDQQRQAEQRRKREQELSEQFLSNESEGPRPAVPPRRNGGRAGAGPTTAATPATSSGRGNARPAVNRPADSVDPDAPPSYEEAASDPPYRPAGSTAAGTMAQGNPLGAYDALRRQHSPNSPSAPIGPYTNRRRSDAARLGRRQSNMPGPPMPGSYQQAGQPGVAQAPGVKDTDERCVVM